MTTQQKYNALSTALSSGTPKQIKDCALALMEDLRGGSPLPTGGALPVPEDGERGCMTMLRDINQRLS